jgi:hypothetical protein
MEIFGCVNIKYICYNYCKAFNALGINFEIYCIRGYQVNYFIRGSKPISIVIVVFIGQISIFLLNEDKRVVVRLVSFRLVFRFWTVFSFNPNII